MNLKIFDSTCGLNSIHKHYFSIRGAVVSSLVLSESLGMCLAFIFGHYFEFHMVPIFVISLMALFSVLLFFFPESPTFLVKQHQMLVCKKSIFLRMKNLVRTFFHAFLLQRAEDSIRFYQNLSEGYKDDKLVKIEINRLTNKIHHDEEESKRNTFKFSDLATVPVRRAFVIGVVLMVLNELSGCCAMLNYTATIFEEAGSNLHPNVSAIVIGAIQLLGSITATNLCDRAGRKASLQRLFHNIFQ